MVATAVKICIAGLNTLYTAPDPSSDQDQPQVSNLGSGDSRERLAFRVSIVALASTSDCNSPASAVEVRLLPGAFSWSNNMGLYKQFEITYTRKSTGSVIVLKRLMAYDPEDDFKYFAGESEKIENSPEIIPGAGFEFDSMKFSI